MDEELNRVITQLKLQLNECRHNLINTQKQIIEYLNQIRYQSGIIEKLRQIKYLKDQFTLRTDTDIDEVFTKNNDVIFETNPTYPLKLSLDFLQINSEAHNSIRKVAKKRTASVKVKIALAKAISNEYFENNVEEEIQINLEEIRNSFVASGNNLFDFIMAYQFEKTLSFDDKVTVYCQLISQYESSFTLTGKYNSHQEIEYAMVYPK
ncbi:hypothetical protein [Niabella ginsengisoli]|uniref:Uncharacterized protein n=1 Tax=Niabella ginsengisoli TaxID=522298 RepID=A0ABS9SFW8_9BACT|nr:hypothetical protein [Niabella ginsengisoli]MCH5597253.1 hypothetical protein [Niabella ginsengisoli]